MQGRGVLLSMPTGGVKVFAIKSQPYVDPEWGWLFHL